MPTITLTDANFRATVLESQDPILVDFWATWCAPCRAVAPVLEELSEEYEGRLRIGKLDVDAAPQTAQMFSIQSIPTIVLFDGGQPVAALQGAQPKPALIELIESNVRSLRRPTITCDELDALIKSNAPVSIVDIRDPRDVSRSHLRHTKVLGEDQLSEHFASLPNGTIGILVCRTGERSLAAAQTLANDHVVALTKGLLEWEGSGRPTYNDAEEAELDA